MTRESTDDGLVEGDSPGGDSIPGNSTEGNPAPEASKPDAPKPDAARPCGPAPAPAGIPPPPGARAPAFPFAKLAVSAVGIGVAIWFWLGSGWMWDVTPGYLAEGRPPLGRGTWAGRYVRLVGARASERPPVEEPGQGVVFVRYAGEDGAGIFVRRAPGGDERLSGRVVPVSFGEGPARMVVDATQGRVNSRAALAVLILVWGIAHAAANVYVWRRRRSAALSTPEPG